VVNYKFPVTMVAIAQFNFCR